MGRCEKVRLLDRALIISIWLNGPYQNPIELQNNDHWWNKFLIFISGQQKFLNDIEKMVKNW